MWHRLVAFCQWLVDLAGLNYEVSNIGIAVKLAMRMVGLLVLPIPRRLVYFLTFRPPSPNPMYTMVPYRTDVTRNYFRPLVDFLCAPLEWKQRRKFPMMYSIMSMHLQLMHWDCFTVLTANGDKVAVVHYKCKNANPTHKTMLYLHGNGDDLGSAYMALCLLGESRNRRDYNLCAMDYAGYGLSTGKATENSVYLSVRTVVEHLRTKMCVPMSSLIVCGWSMGASSAIYIANIYPELRAVILLAPFMSILCVPFEYLQRWSCSLRADIFKNIEMVHNVTCPLMIIHGTHDQVITVKHSVQLYNKATATPKFLALVDRGQHCVLENTETYRVINQFVRLVDKNKTSLM